MNCEWRKATLKEVTTVLGDGIHGTPRYDESGDYYFINGRNLSGGKIILDEKTKKASEDEYLRYKKDLNDRTILVSINGTLGNIAFYNNENVFLGKSVCYFNVIDEVEREFIYYVLKNDVFQDHIDREATGTTIKNVSLKTMREFSFRLPPTEIQKKIVSHLKFLDQKIHLNQQMNKTLESIAQAIFKSWFVDFDPVRAKIQAIADGRNSNRAAMAAIAGVDLIKDWDDIDAALEQKLSRMNENQRQQLQRTAELFPEELVDSELGEVPKGWGVNRIDELGEIVTGKTPPTKNPENYGGDVPFLTIPDMHGKIYAIETSKHLSKKGANTQKNKFLPAGSVNMSCIASPGLVVLNHRVVQTNQQINTLIPNDIENSNFYFFLLRELSDEVIMKGSGGSVFKNMNKGQFSSLKVRVPAKILKGVYNQHVKDLMNNILQKELESQSLRQVRDTFLPRLISGELLKN